MEEIGKPLKWILSNQSGNHSVWYFYSSPSEVPSGVLQGLVLGSTLILVFIHDIDLITNIHGAIRLFALFINQYIHSSIDHLILQQELHVYVDMLTSWVEMWQMQFSINKYSILQLLKHRFIKVYFHDYVM